MKAKCALRKQYDRLVRKHRAMSDDLDIVQGVYGLGYMYDSQLFTDYAALDDKLQGMAEVLKIKRRRKVDPDGPGYEAYLLQILNLWRQP